MNPRDTFLASIANMLQAVAMNDDASAITDAYLSLNWSMTIYLGSRGMTISDDPKERFDQMFREWKNKHGVK